MNVSEAYLLRFSKSKSDCSGILEKTPKIPIILLFLQHFTAYTDTIFQHLMIDSFQNSVPRPVTLILSTDESMLQYIVGKY